MTETERRAHRTGSRAQCRLIQYGMHTLFLSLRQCGRAKCELGHGSKYLRVPRRTHRCLSLRTEVIIVRSCAICASSRRAARYASARVRAARARCLTRRAPFSGAIGGGGDLGYGLFVVRCALCIMCCGAKLPLSVLFFLYPLRNFVIRISSS